MRRIIAETVTPEVIDRMHTTGTFASPELNRALGGAGFLERAVPGLGKGDPIELWVLFHELEKAGAPYDGLGHGDHDRRRRLARSAPTSRRPASSRRSPPGESMVVAWATASPTTAPTWPSITTKAVLDGDEWVINGAKMWTTMAHEANWIILLTRTDPECPSTRASRCSSCPMDTPGISVDAVHTMGTERTNATYYDDVRVGDDAVLGGVERRLDARWPSPSPSSGA